MKKVAEISKDKLDDGLEAVSKTLGEHLSTTLDADKLTALKEGVKETIKSGINGTKDDLAVALKYKIDDAYKIVRLAVGAIHEKGRNQAERLLVGKRDYSFSYGQEKNGLTICSDESVFISSFVDLTDYDITTVRKVANYLNKISDLNTLKVLFGLFSLHTKCRERSSFSIEEIIEITKLDDNNVNKALNNIDIVFDRDEYNKTGCEKYSLGHLDQVQLLVAMLIPALEKYNGHIKDLN